jgi:CheY-like chemotaxis protein
MSELAGVRVFAVDDEPDTLEAMCHYLQMKGAEVRCVTSAAQALREIPPFAPHVVLSDLSMPQMDGFQFLLALRRAGEVMPVVAVTAMQDPAWRERVKMCGFQAFVPKPIEPSELLRLIAELARRDS